MNTTKLTVVKRFVNKDLIREFATNGEQSESQKPCSEFVEGQEFIAKGGCKPEGFCSWAWADIQREVAWVGLGGVQPNYKHPGTAITCCTDGLKPVVFRVERIEEVDE